MTPLALADGNITWVSIFVSQLDGKRQELLLELVPHARQIAAHADLRRMPPSELEALRDAARSAGLELIAVNATRSEENAGSRCGPGGQLNHSAPQVGSHLRLFPLF